MFGDEDRIGDLVPIAATVKVVWERDASSVSVRGARRAGDEEGHPAREYQVVYHARSHAGEPFDVVVARLANGDETFHLPTRDFAIAGAHDAANELINRLGSSNTCPCCLASMGWAERLGAYSCPSTL